MDPTTWGHYLAATDGSARNHATSALNETKLQFDEDSHTYWVGNHQKISVTTLLSQFFQPFDAVLISTFMAKREAKREPMIRDAKQVIWDDWVALRAQAIREGWAESRRRGTALHTAIEHYFNTGSRPETVRFRDNGSPYERPWSTYAHGYEQFVEYNKTRPPSTHVEVEKRVYYGTVAGSIDAVFHNEDGTVDLVDWKRIKGLKYRGKPITTPPFKNWRDCNVTKYNLQLNCYRYMMEQLGYRVRKMSLVVFSPGKPYQVVDVPRIEAVTNLPWHGAQ